MTPVEVLLFHAAEDPAGTELWISGSVYDLLVGGIVSDAVRLEKMIRRIRSLCDSDLRVHMPDTVKPEYGKTYGIHLDQYRIVGFFDRNHRDFIALDWFVKKTQKNDRRMNAVYQKVDEIRKAGTWSRTY